MIRFPKMRDVSTWSTVVAGGLLIAGTFAAGCSTEAYCFQCSEDTGTGGVAGIFNGTGGSSGAHIGGFGGSSGNGGMKMMLGGNCEGADLQKDPANCGTCGHTCDPLDNTVPACVNGACSFTCSTNYHDIDADLTKATSDGCEYYCAVQGNSGTGGSSAGGASAAGGGAGKAGNGGTAGTAGKGGAAGSAGKGGGSAGKGGSGGTGGSTSAGGSGTAGTSATSSTCGIDALCKGPTHIYDGCDFQNDPLNCGMFHNVCMFDNGMGTCAMGKCQVACEAGFGPDSSKPLPNCECPLVNGGKDTCGHDNNCDGKITADTTTDPENCGACGTSCDGKFANTVPTCQMGQCVLGACYPGYTNNTGDPMKDGCNYDCSAECNIPFADVMCNGSGMCTFLDCKPGHYDLNMDLKDGCEYSCTPTGTVACNGKDNKCDGKINEGFDVSKDPDNCGVCGCACAAFYPGANTTCNVVTPGACDIANCALSSCPMGSKEVTPGSCYVCPVFPTTVETCNGQDDDCDGIADDNLTDTGDACTTTLLSACAAGKNQCQPKTAGDLSTDAIVCVAVIEPTPETCNGIDDDCDGIIDNAPPAGFLPGVGDNCGKSNQGTCKFGETKCVNGTGKDITQGGNAPDSMDKISCLGEVDPGVETCNGKDDDCNGVIDDAVTDPTLNMTCGSAVGLCKQGTNLCQPSVAGNPSTDSLVCVGSVGANPEICDGATKGTGKDENCNGMVDEGCVFAVDAIVRLDTTGSNQGAASSFSLQATSINSEYLLAYSDERNGNSDIYVRTSTDAGSTWGAGDVKAVGSGSIEVEPAPFMRAGRAYVAYSNFNGGDIRTPYVTSANSPYTAWAAGVQVHDAGGAADCFSPQGVVAKVGATAATDVLAVVWSEIAGTAITPTRDIKISYSKNSGTTWSTAILVNAASAGKAELPQVATDGNGVVYIAWQDTRTKGIAPVYFAKIDVTATTPAISTSIALQNVAAANASSEQISIVASGATVDVAWIDLRNKAKTVRVAASIDGGTTWTKVAGVVDGIVIVDANGVASDAAAPSLAIQGTNVVAVWEDTRSGESDIRANHSTDGGLTWQSSNPRVDTGDTAGLTASSMPQVAIGSGAGAATHVYVAWQDQRFPSSAILAGESLDLGTTWEANASLLRGDIDSPDPAAPATSNGSAADSQTPFILASPLVNQASMTWIDFRDGAGANGVNGDIWSRLLHLARGRGVTSDSDARSSNDAWLIK